MWVFIEREFIVVFPLPQWSPSFCWYWSAWFPFCLSGLCWYIAQQVFKVSCQCTHHSNVVVVLRVWPQHQTSPSVSARWDNVCLNAFDNSDWAPSSASVSTTVNKAMFVNSSPKWPTTLISRRMNQDVSTYRCAKITRCQYLQVINKSDLHES